MDDLISRQAAVEVIDAVFPVDPMKSEYAQGIACGAALAKTYVEQLPSAQSTIEERKWIPCSERLPRQGQEVICQCRANMIRVLKLDAYGDWYQDAEHCYMSGFVIAWMPLPEPWRGEEYEI